MSRGSHNYAHKYNGPRQSRGSRLTSKLGNGRISVKKLERLLKEDAMKRTARQPADFGRRHDDEEPERPPDDERDPRPDEGGEG